MSIGFTIFSSSAPPRLTKVFGLNAAGELTKQTAAQMTAGTAERVEVGDLHQLAARLAALTPAQAVAWGLAAQSKVNITTAANEARINGTTPADDPTEVAARTRTNFAFANGPGILMLDHDGLADGVLTPDQFRDRLIEACPELADAPMLWRSSASAGLVAPDGRELTGLHRHRLYIPVTNATGIPEAGKRLTALLWAAGHGWHVVGKAGQALARCLVDTSVWQPERLDFAAAPILNDGIRRPNADARTWGDVAAALDLARIVVTPTQHRAAQQQQQASRRAIAAACTVQRDRWADEHAPALAAARGISGDEARALLIRASEHNVLMGDFMLITSRGERISVGEVLDNPERWHNTRFADPLEPDNDLRVAVINLRSGGRPFLFTHRHGGMRFELRRQSARVRVGRGLRIVSTDAVLEVLRARGELFDFGEGAVAYVADGRARPVGVEWMTDHMGRVCDFYSVRTRKTPDGGEELVDVAEDAPQPVARAVLAKHGERGFGRLQAVVTAPTLRADGSVLDAPGFDADSGLLYYCADTNVPRVPLNPSPADALAALRLLWAPFAGFPLVDDVARGVVLHGLLTAAIRAALPTAPGIALDAPAAGTGKTLLARCIGILADGGDPAILPPADTDEETRKRLFAALRDGSRVLLWDNVREPLGCAALDSFLTAATFRDRVLGASEVIALPNRSMFIATGNNLRLTGDTCRRIFLARLDAQSEQPYARDFDFDPVLRIGGQRMRYVVAALTLIRAYIAAGRPKVAAGRTASFETWDDLVRQPICWLAGLVRDADATDLPALGDPLEAARRAFDQDPESTKHAALLNAWHDQFSGMPTTVAGAVRATDLDADSALRAALEEIGGQGARINTRIVGRWIERHVGRRIGGFWFERGTMLGGLATWRVRREPDAPAPENKPTTHTTPTTGDRRQRGNGPESGGFGGSGGFVSGHGRAGFEAETDAEAI